MAEIEPFNIQLSITHCAFTRLGPNAAIRERLLQGTGSDDVGREVVPDPKSERRPFRPDRFLGLLVNVELVTGE